MDYLILILGVCLFVSVFVARVVAVLRMRNPRSRRHDEKVQDSIDKWRAENWGWRRKTRK